MKFTAAATVAALLGSAAAKDTRTFAVLRFNNKELTRGRMDPIVSPGKTSGHVHTIFGGSGFSISATGDDLSRSQCTSAKIKGDNSAYWAPALMFKDPKTGKIEPVEVFYANAYYL
jgi:poly(3-hydroxybutyrate) depolymerase